MTNQIGPLRGHLSRGVLILALAAGTTPGARAEAGSAIPEPPGTPVACPQSGALARPGSVGLGDIQVHESASALCWKTVAPGVQLSWPYATDELDPGRIAALVKRAEVVARRAVGLYESLLSPRATVAPTRAPGGRILIGFYPGIDEGTSSLGGFHYFDDRDSLIYLTADPVARMRDTDTRWIDLVEHTMAHEMFHAMQRQFSSATPGRIEPWIGEALADWGARAVNGNNGPWLSDGRFLYHRAMGRFFGQIGLGLRNTAYSAHLFWQWYATEQGLESLGKALERYAHTGREADLVRQLGLATSWHDFARTLVNLGPWQLVADHPAYPDSWTLPIDSVLDRATTGSARIESILYPLSARRYRIDPRDDEQGLRLQWLSPDPALVRASVLLLPEGSEIELMPGTNELCFNPRRGCVPRPESIEVLVSNADPDITQQATLGILDSPTR